MGPVAHSHEFDLPKKVRALGLRHALSSKAKSGSIVVLDEAKSKAVKTGDAGQAVRQARPAKRARRRRRRSTRTSNCRARNLAHVALLPAAGLNVYDIMQRDKLVLTKAALTGDRGASGMNTHHDIILSPVITEKATKLTETNQVVFRVTLDATKPQIAKAVEELFKVKVKAVNTVTRQGQEEAVPRQAVSSAAISRKRS